MFPRYVHHNLLQSPLRPYAYFPKTLINIVLPPSSGSS